MTNRDVRYTPWHIGAQLRSGKVRADRNPSKTKYEKIRGIFRFPGQSILRAIFYRTQTSKRPICIAVARFHRLARVECLKFSGIPVRWAEEIWPSSDNYTKRRYIEREITRL